MKSFAVARGVYRDWQNGTKYGYGQYNGILRILMGQVNCIDSDESNGEK